MFGIIAAILLYGTGHPILFWLSVLGALASLWSWGVMHNYAMEAAKQRRSFFGGFYDITPTEANLVPNWITWLNMAFTLVSLAVLIAAIVIRIS
jgi:hypothetical protein